MKTSKKIKRSVTYLKDEFDSCIGGTPWAVVHASICLNIWHKINHGMGNNLITKLRQDFK